MQRADSSQLRKPAEDREVGRIEPPCLVADFTEGGLHDLFRRDGIAQDAERQRPQAQGVARGELREGSDVTVGDPIQQGNIRDRLFPGLACLYGDACHVASQERAPGVKSAAERGGSR